MRLHTLLVPLLFAACGHDPASGHDHGSDEGHGGADPHEEEGESVAITRWTDTHELFVELDAPVVGQPFSYHAHVTRLSDNHAATTGVMLFRFERDGALVSEHRDEAVARPGIFASTAQPPAQAGTYALVVVYEAEGERAEWDAGVVEVGADAGVAHTPAHQGQIAFLKESQWQIPFAVELADERALASEVSAFGVVRPSPATTAVVAAPVDGLIAWSESMPVTGRSVRRGERLATLLPAGAADGWASLQADVATARIDRDLAQRDLERLQGLAPGDLVSTRRLDQARADVERSDAQLRGAQGRVRALTSEGAGALPILAPADGVLVSVGVGHGEPVAAGAPVIAVSTGGELLIEARVHERVNAALGSPQSLSVMRGDWDVAVDVLAHGGTLLTQALIYDRRSLSAPLAVIVPASVGLSPGDLVELAVGIGVPVPKLAVPRTAVIEVNGQHVIFVQDTGESFSRRRVGLGDGDATHVEVLWGIEQGEMVVSVGGFDVHVASLTGALESHRH